MKYFFAIDKGSFRNAEDRYKKLDLSKINTELGKNDNLKALVKFSTAFQTRKELKDFLIAKGLLSKDNSIYDLVIYYEYNYPRVLDVAYKCDEDYLNFGRLSSIIYENLKNKNFFDVFTDYYSKYSHLIGEIKQIETLVNNPYANHLYFDAIRRLVNKVCYTTKNGKEELNYNQLYDLGMYVSKLANKERNKIISKVEKPVNTSNPGKFIPEVGTPEYDKWEEWQDRLKAMEDNQTKLL